MDVAIGGGTPPTADEIADALGLPAERVIDAFRELHDSHVVVLEPGHGDRLRMANPFSAVPTGFRATVGGRSWWGNCIWDGLGIISMMGGTGVLAATCPDCGEPQEVTVQDRKIQTGSGVAFIGVPASSWWQDIVYT
jgi:hypothetical protein